jgi:hypothetical protein
MPAGAMVFAITFGGGASTGTAADDGLGDDCAPRIGGAVMSAGGRPTAGKPLPQLRQNFIPTGFSPLQVGQITGNPGTTTGVCAASPLPQFRQNAAPTGLSWPHAEQRIQSLVYESLENFVDKEWHGACLQRR